MSDGAQVPTIQRVDITELDEGFRVRRRERLANTPATTKGAAMQAHNLAAAGISVILTIPGEPERLYRPEWATVRNPQRTYRLQCAGCKEWRICADASSYCRNCWRAMSPERKAALRKAATAD